jgi:hypothetical protein
MELSGRLYASAALPSGKNPVPVEEKVWCTPEPVGTGDEKNLFPLPDFEPRIFQLIA